MGVGSVRTQADAENVLTAGADLVAVGRAALIEPDWARRIRNDEPVRTCLASIDGDKESVLPPPLYRKILSAPGWLPICGESSMSS
jgi:2,4-dienoyl-CoA reductase-like NADH-dependent reductase (Old Yellow Enzyme family)